MQDLKKLMKLKARYPEIWENIEKHRDDRKTIYKEIFKLAKSQRHPSKSYKRTTGFLGMSLLFSCIFPKCVEVWILSENVAGDGVR